MADGTRIALHRFPTVLSGRHWRIGNCGLPGGAAQPKRSPRGKSALPAVSRLPQVVAELIPLEFEDKPPKRRAAPASTVIEGRTGRAAFSAGLVVLSPHSGLTS